MASVTYSTDLGKYEVETPHAELTANTADDADKIAREKVTAFLATLGIAPNFINE